MRRFSWSALIALLLSSLITSFAASAADREYALKAGFLYNFARYSEGYWFDPSINNEYIICSPDEVFVRVAKQVLRDQFVKSRPVKVIQISSAPTQCHSLFLSSSQDNSLLNHEHFHHTMLVGQSSDFISKGGHISFFIAGGKVRFEVNPDRLEEAGIKLSAKVLRIGRVVGKEAR